MYGDCKLQALQGLYSALHLLCFTRFSTKPIHEMLNVSCLGDAFGRN